MIHDTNIMLEVDGILQNTVAGFFMELMYSFCDLDIVMLLILFYYIFAVRQENTIYLKYIFTKFKTVL